MRVIRHSAYVVLLATVTVSGVACRTAAPFDARNQSTRAPDPSGCYIRVFDAPDYRGADEYINGPVKLERLTVLPGGKSWHRRIRSARLGPASTVTVWTGEKYAGQRWTMAETAYSNLPGQFDKTISSMEIGCAPKTTPLAASFF
jgi:hypothetical protein